MKPAMHLPYVSPLSAKKARKAAEQEAAELAEWRQRMSDQLRPRQEHIRRWLERYGRDETISELLQIEQETFGTLTLYYGGFVPTDDLFDGLACKLVEYQALMKSNRERAMAHIKEHERRGAIPQ